MTKPLIVGVDIGVTTGLAIYDLNRNLLHVGSKRNISIDNVIREISFYGKPLIIATDKKRTPQPINKIAASFNCKVFSPDHDLTIEEKEEIIRIPIKDIHEKDALAAATYAYKHFAPQFNNIDRNLDSLGLSQYRDKVKELIINKEAKNIAEAIEKIKPKEEKVEKAPEVVKEVYLNWREKTKELENKLKEEERRCEILKTYSEKIEDKLKDLERQKQEYLEEEIKKNEEARKKVIKEKEIKSRDILIKQLQFELAKQRNFKNVFEEQLRIQEEIKNIENENLIPVIIIPSFSKENILNVNRRFKIENKIVWIKSFTFSRKASSVLMSLRPKIVIGELDKEIKDILEKRGIITVDSIVPEERKYYAAVSPEKIENEIKQIERKNFFNWLDEYRKRTN
jgi:hypothetical protein